MKPKNLHYLTISASALIALALDYGTKLWVVSDSFKPIVFIKDFFYLTAHQRNDGIAFGIDLPMPVQIIGSVVVLFILFDLANGIFVKNSRHPHINAVCFGMIAGGAFGNLIDRVTQGSVVDFIVLGPIPLFNIADTGITVGLIGILILMLAEQRTTERKTAHGKK